MPGFPSETPIAIAGLPCGLQRNPPAARRLRGRPDKPRRGTGVLRVKQFNANHGPIFGKSPKSHLISISSVSLRSMTVPQVLALAGGESRGAATVASKVLPSPLGDRSLVPLPGQFVPCESGRGAGG